MALLTLKSFTVQFKNEKKEYLTAVSAINLTLNTGEITGLIGESGSGKSVTSLSITRLIEEAKVSGQAIYDDGESTIDLVHCNPSELKRIRQSEIAYIFQEPMTALNPLMTCGKQIMENASSALSVQELLRRVELGRC